MSVEKQRIRDYSTALEKINLDLQNENISTIEYEEQQKDFLDQIRESVSVVEDYKSSIVDLYTEIREKENDVVQESISKYKDLLSIRKQNDSYSRDIKSQTKKH